MKDAKLLFRPGRNDGAEKGLPVTRYLLLLLFIGTAGSRALGLELGLAPGISIKNVMLYAVASSIAIESAMLHNRKIELLPVIVPFALLVAYALLTWLYTILFLDNPYYFPRPTLIRLKIKLVDQFLMLLVFFYGVVNWQQAFWLLKALIWAIVFGCFVTVIDTFDVPDLGVISARDVDGRVEGFIGSAQDFGGLLAFALPLVIALWWTETGIKKLLALSGVGLVLISIMLSASRGAMLGIVAGSILAAIYLRRYISRQMLMRATFAVVVLTLLATLFVLSTEFGYLLETRMTRGVDSGDVETLSSGRTAIWSAAIREMAEHPLSYISGLGWESYFQTIGHRYATHSVYLDRFYNLGLIGLTLFIYSFAGAAAVARRGLATITAQGATPFLMATVFGIAAFTIAMAFSDIHGAALYAWALMGIALRVACSGVNNADTPAGAQRLTRG